MPVRRLIIAITVFLASVSVMSLAQQNPAQRKAVTFSALQAGFAQPDMLYGPYMFWFWDEPVDSSKAGQMARKMAEQNFNPGYIHGRQSWTGPGLPHDQWLAEPWFSAVDSALSGTEAAGKLMGYVDEYMWPCLRADWKVVSEYPDMTQESLCWRTLDLHGGDTVAIPTCYFAVAARLASPLSPGEGDALVPDVHMGDWIWNGTPTQGQQTCYFRKSFDISAGTTAINGLLKIAADDNYTLYLDGQLIGQGGVWTSTWTTYASIDNYDIAARLTPGRHTVAVCATNQGAQGGFLFGMAARLTDGTVLRVQSDRTWLTTFSYQANWQQTGFQTTGWGRTTAFATTGAWPWYLSPEHCEQADHKPRTVMSQTLRLVASGTSLNWTAPQDGDWRVYLFYKWNGEQVNYLDDRLGSRFIPIGDQPYASRYPNSVGKSITGDFMDNEGGYGLQVAWSDTLERLYTSKYGTDIRLWTPLLLDNDQEGVCGSARCRYFDTVSDIYSGNFKAVSDWHEARGMYTTGHFWEGGLIGQLRMVGDHLRQCRAMSMPGCDCLELSALDPRSFKEAQSVAEFKGSRFMTEFMGAGGWDVFTPANVKSCTNSAFAWGVSHVIPHGLFMNRDFVGNQWLPDWYDENPMWPYMHLWTDLVRRGSYINSSGSHAADVLLLYPMETIWALSDYETFDSRVSNVLWEYPSRQPSGVRINSIESAYWQVIESLSTSRIEYLIGESDDIRKMQVTGPRLNVGDYSFKTVVLPPIDVLPLDVAAKLVAFAQGGGSVYALGELPNGSTDHGFNDPQMGSLMQTLRSLPTFHSTPNGIAAVIDAPGLERQVQFISGSFNMLQHHRRIDGREFFWLVNNAGQSQCCEVKMLGAHGQAAIWDCETGRVRQTGSADQPDGSMLALKFKPYEAYWVVFDPSQPASAPVQDARTQMLASVQGQWKVTIDPSIQPNLQFPTTPPSSFTDPGGAVHSLESWNNWGLQKFSGFVDYYKTISITSVEPAMQLDLGTVCYVAEVWVNGVSVGQRMWGPYVYDVSSALHTGSNDIHVRVGNLVNNSYGLTSESGLLGPVTLTGTCFAGLPAPKVWLRGDSIVGLSDGDRLAVWRDSGGSGLDATQSSAANQPALAVGPDGRRSVHFDALSSSQLSLTRPVQDDFTIMCVFKSSQGLSTGTDWTLGAGLVDASDFGMSLSADRRVLAGTGSPITCLASQPGLGQGAYHVATLKRVRSSGAVSLYVDGALVESKTGGTAALAASSRLTLGSLQSNIDCFSGDVADVLIYDSALSDADRQPVEKYLMLKSGVIGPTVARLSDAKRLGPGAQIVVVGKQMTAVPGGSVPVGTCYVEESDRSSGLRLDIGGAVVGDFTPSVGQNVTFSGKVLVTPQGEKYVQVDTMCADVASPAIGPLGMSNNSAASGLCCGLLVKIWGKVLDNSGSGYYTITDGAGQPTKVVCGANAKPAIGDYVSRVGVASSDASGVVLYER